MAPSPFFVKNMGKRRGVGEEWGFEGHGRWGGY